MKWFAVQRVRLRTRLCRRVIAEDILRVLLQ